MNKKNISLVIGFIIVAIIAFYGGYKYASSKNINSQNSNGFSRGNLPNGGPGGGQRGTRVGGGTVFGTILSKDSNSITVQLGAMGPNGSTTASGSKIVLYTDKTIVSKTVDGNLNDLIVGKEISVNGVANSDGSVSANSIQIRTNLPAPQTQSQ